MSIFEKRRKIRRGSRPFQVAVRRNLRRLAPENTHGQRKRWTKIAEMGLDAGSKNTGVQGRAVPGGSDPAQTVSIPDLPERLRAAGFSEEEIAAIVAGVG